jgi:hypothetical protein
VILIYTLLYLVGLFLWGEFFDWGSYRFNVQDWQVHFSYLEIIKSSLVEGSCPFFVNFFVHGTNHFLAIPEIIFTPDILLLKYFSVEQFWLIHLFIFYSIGFLGFIAIQKHFTLSISAFFLLFLLVNFNGYIAGHLAIGHLMWSGYFLLPWITLFLIKLPDASIKRNVYLISLFAFLLILNGSAHFYIWFLIFLILQILFCEKDRRTSLYLLGLILLLGFSRLFPAQLYLSEVHDQYFVGGYATFQQMISAFIVDYQIDHRVLRTAGETFTPGWWEYDFYISSLGALFIFYFGLIKSITQKELAGYKIINNYKYPLIIILFFSLGFLYQPLFTAGIPVLSTQRVVSRMLVIPFLFLVIASVVNFNQTYPNLDRFKKLVFWLFALQLFSELLQHFLSWRISEVERLLNYITNPVDVVPQIITKVDPWYEWIVLISAIISSAVFFVVLFLLIKDKLFQKNNLNHGK